MSKYNIKANAGIAPIAIYTILLAVAGCQILVGNEISNTKYILSCVAALVCLVLYFIKQPLGAVAATVFLFLATLVVFIYSPTHTYHTFGIGGMSLPSFDVVSLVLFAAHLYLNWKIIVKTVV